VRALEATKFQNMSIDEENVVAARLATEYLSIIKAVDAEEMAIICDEGNAYVCLVLKDKLLPAFKLLNDSDIKGINEKLLIDSVKNTLKKI